MALDCRKEGLKMARTTKWILIIAGAVTVLGLVVFGIALAFTGGDFTKFSTANYVTFRAYDIANFKAIRSAFNFNDFTDFT